MAVFSITKFLFDNHTLILFTNAAFIACHFSGSTACSFIVRALWHCHHGLIAELIHSPESKRIQPYTLYPFRQSGKVINLLGRCCLPLGHAWVSSGAFTVVQIYHQSSKALNNKLVWDRHKTISRANNVPGMQFSWGSKLPFEGINPAVLCTAQLIGTLNKCAQDNIKWGYTPYRAWVECCPQLNEYNL